MVNDGLHTTLTKIRGILLVFVLLEALSWPARGAWAQVGAPNPLAVPGRVTAPLATKGSPETAPAEAVEKEKPAPVKPAEKEKPAKAKATKRAPVKKASREQSAPPPKPVTLVGHRDPFRLPVPGRAGEAGIEEIKGPLPPGTRGLIVNQLKLEGIVRQDLTNTMIAVVVPYSVNRAYFLREKDVVYNGVVSKITPDSIYFTENYLDQYGRPQLREVVKRLGSAPGEVR